jgi:hypothetical protein
MEAKKRPHATKRWDAQKCKDRILQVIAENPNIVFLTDIFLAVEFSKDTFNKYCPAGSPEHTEIIAALDKNKCNTKSIIRDRLLDSNNVTGLIALYKLLGTREERLALSQARGDREEKQQEEEIKLEIQ